MSDDFAKETDDLLNLGATKAGDETEVEGKAEEKVEVVEPEAKPVVEEEKEEPQKEEKKEPTVDLAKIQEENQRLREQLNELAKQTGGIKPPPTEEKAKTEEQVREEKKEELIQFVTDDEAEELLDNPKKLNEFLNRLYQAGRERTMLDMPALVRQQTLSEIRMQQLTTKFWGDNEDLKQYRDFVAMVANQIEIQNPNWDYEKVFEETAKVARTRLNLPASGEKPKEEKGEEVDSKPALPSKRGARTTVQEPAITPEQKELEDLFKFAGN